MAKFYISSVEVVEGHLYEKFAEDEKIVVYDCYVNAVVDDKVYRHNHIFFGAFQDEHEGYWHVDYNAKSEAERLANRVADKGMIDTSHWEYIGNLSENLTDEEREERAWSDKLKLWNMNMGLKI